VLTALTQTKNDHPSLINPDGNSGFRQHMQAKAVFF